MTLEELSVVFSADLAPFSAAIQRMGAMLSDLDGRADGLAVQFSDAGRRAGEGLQKGLLSQRAAVAAAALQVAQAAASALRGALQIHSPSRLTYEMGRYFDEGLMQGILDGVGRVEQAAGRLSDRAVYSLSPQSPLPASAPPPSLDQALSRIAITIPLEIDGYRLGVAAIDGINRVSRSAGKTGLQL